MASHYSDLILDHLTQHGELWNEGTVLEQAMLSLREDPRKEVSWHCHKLEEVELGEWILAELY